MNQPLLKHDNEFEVSGHPLLTYTHERGTKRVVDRASGIDVRIILQWLREGVLPADLQPESVEACVRYQSELDAAEALLAWRTCTPPAEMLGAAGLIRFRLLPVADRELLAKLLAPFPMELGDACSCNVPVLMEPTRGLAGAYRCTRCFCCFSWNPEHDYGLKRGIWRGSPTFADSLAQIR